MAAVSLQPSRKSTSPGVATTCSDATISTCPPRRSSSAHDTLTLKLTLVATGTSAGIGGTTSTLTRWARASRGGAMSEVVETLAAMVLLGTTFPSPFSGRVRVGSASKKNSTPALPEAGEGEVKAPYPTWPAAWKPAMRPNVAARQMPCWPKPPEESPHA